MFLLRHCSSKALSSLDLLPKSRCLKTLAVNQNAALVSRTKKQSVCCGKDSLASFHISSEHELTNHKPDPPILASLERCMEDGLTWSTSLQKLRLRSVTKDLHFLHQRGFPLPESLTKQQWERLVGLLEKGHRNMYLDAIKNGEDEEEKYRELKDADAKAQRGLTFNEDTFKNVLKKEHVHDMSLEDKIHMINFVYQEMKDAGEVLPIMIKEKGLKELISLKDTRSIQNFFAFQATLKTRKELDFVKKRVASVVSQEIQKKVQAERANEQHLVYGLGHNVIMLKHYPKDMDRSMSWNAVREFNEWGQPLVIDLSFMGMMSYKNAKGMAYREITYSLLANREHPTPFQLHFTNYNEKCDKTQLLFDLHPYLRDDPAFPAALSPKCHTELFDKDRLVYLTPDSKNDLNTFSGNDIYVIGALNDRGVHAPYTLAQARKDGIRHARLPLRRHIG